MRFKSVLFALPLSLLLVAPHMSFADSLTLKSTDGGIFPYEFSIDGSKTLTALSCLNDTRNVYVGETWDVTILTLSSITGSVDAGQTSLNQLKEDAYLDSLYDTGFDGSSNTDVQKAIWDIQDTSDYSHLSTLEKTLVGDAVASLATENASFYSQFTVFIPTSTREGGRDGEPQQFMEYTPGTPPAAPEPSSLILLGTGLIGAAGMMRRKIMSKIAA